MPPRLAKKTAIAKRRVSIATASSRKVEVVPPPCTDSPPAAIGETTAPETDSFLGKDQTGKSDPIMTEEEESLQSDKVSRSRAAKRRAVVKVAASMVKKEAVASVARDQIEQKTGSLLDKEAETEKSESVKDEKDGTVEEPVEEEENIEIIGVEKEIEEEPVKKEVQDEGEKIEKAETEELTNREEIEEGEPVGEEQVEEEEPIEEEPMEEGEPVEEEPVEGGGEEEPVEEEEPMEQEPIEEEPMEEEEEEEEVEEVEEEDEEEVEEEEEDELEEEEEEEEVGKGDGKVELIQGTNNEEKRDIVAVKDVQPASVYGGGGEGEDQGLDDVPEPTMYMKALLPNRKVKETQIFISQLEKTVVEEDIAKVFAKFGEIQSIRVIRHSLTQKSKGYAFLQYSTAEAVEKALCQLKDGTEIKGKTVHISASNQENCTLFVGNICKSWSKDQVLDALKGLGVEGIEQIALPEDPKIEGKSKGFAFVEFCTHIDAKAALNHLCKPDAVLGCDFSAKVSFAQLSVNHSEELLAKVKTVYLEPVPTSWDGKKIEEICKEYGAIEKIKLYRKSKSSKKKDFAFVEFVSRESALNCVEGLNKAPVGHGDTKVSASIARPYARKTGMKFMIRGNFKVKKSNEKVEMKEVKIIKSSDEKVEKEEVKIIEVSGETKKKRKRPKLKDVIYQKPKALSPKKKIKKNKKLHKKVPNVETHKEAPHRHAPKEGHNKEAPVPIQPQGSKKRLFKKAPESSRRLTKGKMKHEKGTQGGPHPHQSGTKKPKPFKGSKQHQRGGPAFNNERAFKKSRNDHYGDHNHGSPIDRRLSVEYAYAPPPYTSSIHEPHYTSRIHEFHYTSRIHEPHYTSRIHEPPYTSRIHEPSRHEPPYISRTHEPSRREPYAYVSGSYHPHRSDLAPHAGYVPPTHHAPRTRHVYEPSAPAPYDGGYDRAIVYTREPPIPPTSHPGNVTYPRYQQPSYPYPIGGSYPADYAPRRSYY